MTSFRREPKDERQEPFGKNPLAPFLLIEIGFA